MQPALFLNVMVVVPALTAVTKPVVEIVATPVAEDVHALVVAGVPLPVN